MCSSDLGLVNFNDNLGLFGFLAGQSLSERDQQASRDAYQSFKQLTDQFPESRYAEDARVRMDYIVNALAEYEVHVARYYLRRGALVGRRYSVVPIVDDLHARHCIRYVPLNPVLHKLERDPAKWRWSTHAILTGRRDAPPWFDRDRALRCFGFRSGAEYERFVLADTPLALPPMTPREARDHRVLLMAQVGIPLAEIATRFGLSERHVSRIVATSAIRTVAI